MDRWILSLTFIGLVFGLVGCQSFNVRSDWDAEVSLANFNRYYWLEPPPAEGVSPFADNSLLRKRVRTVLETALAERGFQVSSGPDDADFLVTYHVILEERLKVDSYSTSTGGLHRGRYDFGSIHSTANVQAYQESTMIIDFLSPSTEDLVWRGWATGVIATRDRGRGNKNLEPGVRAILDRFPPTAE